VSVPLFLAAPVYLFFLPVLSPLHYIM
jgi:hypothetical protein